MAKRAQWGSRLGFIFAAAGSAVGLGNIWKFPYETGANGGGIFVLVYLGCVLLVGLPVMSAEIMLGRAAQSSPVGAMRKLAGAGSGWISFGWLATVASFLIFSYYSVVAGWSLHYVWLSLTGTLGELGAGEAGQVFAQLKASPLLNIGWHLLFMGLTIGVVVGGVTKGVERWSRILMPALFAMLLFLLVKAFTLSGFGEGVRFVFGFHAGEFSSRGVITALGQAFFSLSLGMGSIMTYGSYLRKDDDIPAATIIVSAVDTGIALLASIVLFPIIFTQGMSPDQGEGLVFKSIPIALSQMPAAGLLGTVFFGLLVVAALTSAISGLEVITAYLIDEKGWTRKPASLAAGAGIAAFGIPSALSGSVAIFGSDLVSAIGMDWFGALSNLTNNYMLPLGGMGIALFTGWRMDAAMRKEQFLAGTRLGLLYRVWLMLLKYLVPVAIALVFLNSVGLIGA